MNKVTFKAILQGFKNYTFPNEHFEKLATERAKICAACPHANPKKIFKNFKDGKTSEIEGLGCDLCGCLLSAKVRQALSTCPDKPKRWE